LLQGVEIIPNKPPTIKSLVELIKPVTWFPPMWAFLCGTVSTGGFKSENLALILAGLFLSGPLVCGMSQAVNDWCDRHVDAINQPDRPIPSGRVSAKWGLGVGVFMSLISLAFAYSIDSLVFLATVFGVGCAWIYSIEPIRLKKSAVFGPGIVAICYEGLPWFTGAVIFSVAFPSNYVLAVLMLYALGAHGIMTLNDFKAKKGDSISGVRSLPVILGEDAAAKIACCVMFIPQLIITGLFFHWGSTGITILLFFVLTAQMVAMFSLLKNPEKNTPFFNMTGVLLYIVGMMISANGLFVITGVQT
jgi:chlorophyll synthase